MTTCKGKSNPFYYFLRTAKVKRDYLHPERVCDEIYLNYTYNLLVILREIVCDIVFFILGIGFRKDVEYLSI